MSLAAARAAARRRMRDTVTVVRASGAPVTAADGTVTQGTTSVWTGPARVSYPRVQPQDITPGEMQAARLRLTVSLPADVDDVRISDEVIVTDAPLDAALVGRRCRVAAVVGGQVSARRLECEEVQS